MLLIRKHNIGRISIIIVALNVIFLLTYMAEKNELEVQKTQSQQKIEEVVEKKSMLIYEDETVDGSYAETLENIITSKKYDEEEIQKIMLYEFYLTDIVTNTKSVTISDNEVMIYAADQYFPKYVEEALTKILSKGDE